jgi:integrase
MKTYLELNEVELIEQAAEYLRDKLLTRLLFHLGCRSSEALGITVSDIDFGQSSVTIEHLKTRLKLSCPRCGDRLSRTAKFCPGCAQLTFWTNPQLTERIKVGGKLCPHDPELKLCKDGKSTTSWCKACRVRIFMPSS